MRKHPDTNILFKKKMNRQWIISKQTYGDRLKLTGY